MGFFLATDPPFRRADFSFDGDVIVHEYVHGLTNRLVGGPSNPNALFFWQSGAMGEGWSDAYANSLTDDAVTGEYITENTETGIRTVAYDDSPYTYGRFGTLLEIPLNGGVVLGHPEVHFDGEIWATVLYDLSRFMPDADYEAMLTVALAMTPPRPSMLDARDAILLAAAAPGAGGPDECGMWEVFAARGFGASAAPNHMMPGEAPDTALSVFEAFDLPAACGGSPPGAGVQLRFFDFEAEGANGWVPEGLWHRSGRRAAGGSASMYFGQEATGDYDTGFPEWGSLISPMIDLADPTLIRAATLEWDQFLNTENSLFPVVTPDSGWVQISTDGGATWETVAMLSHDSDFFAGAFDHHKVDISRFAGNDIWIRFHFDTLDADFNFFEGWYIDNVEIRSVPELDADVGALAVGTPVSASINTIGDSDWYTFPGVAGEVAVISMNATAGSSLDSAMWLFAPSGAVEARNNDGGAGVNAELRVPLAETGTYTLRTRARRHRSWGGYELSMLKLASLPDVGGGTILPEVPVSGSIDFTFDTDDWTFDGVAGQVVDILLSPVTASVLDPVMSLWAPDGSRVIGDDDSGGELDARIVWRLKQTGIYTIKVAGTKYGDYDLVFGFPLVDDPDGGAITPGVPAFGAIDRIGDSDGFTFFGLAGDLIRATLDAGTASDVDPFLALASPSGFVEFFNDNSGLGNGSLIEVPLFEDGPWTLVAMGGTPTVDVVRVDAEVDPFGRLVLRVFFTADTSMEQVGFIAHLDVDQDPSTGVPPFFWGGRPGQDIGVDVVLLYFLDPFAGPAFVVLDAVDFGFIGFFPALLAGQFVEMVVPLEAVGDLDGNIDVTLVAGNDVQLTDWVPSSSHGTVGLPAPAGGPAAVATAGSYDESTRDDFRSLLNKARSAIAGAQLSPAPQSQLPPGITILDDPEGDAIRGSNLLGDYEISFELVTDTGEGALLQVGTPVFGGIDVAGIGGSEADFDYVAFQGTAGTPVLIGLTRDGASLLDAYLVLIDPSGKEVAFADGYEEQHLPPDPLIETVLEANGFYFVGIGNHRHSIGDYEVNLAVDTGGGLVAFGETLSGAVDLGKDTDYFPFFNTGLNDVTITLAADVGSELQPAVALLDADFNFMTADVDFTPGGTATIQTTLVENGLYYLGVSGILPRSAGGYTISVDGTPTAPTPSTYTLVNHDFETGTLGGWTMANIPGGGFSGWETIDETFGPPFPAPFEGGFSATTFQFGPSMNVLLQEVTLSPGLTAATVSWADQWLNFAGFFEPGYQEYRVEIRDTDNNTLDVAYWTGPDTDPFTGWTIRSADLSPYIGQTIRILFIEKDSFGPLYVLVDDVTIRETTTVAIPAVTPMALAGMAAGLALVLWWTRTRRKETSRSPAL